MSNEPTLVSISLDANGDTQAVYELPHPIAWLFKHYNAESGQHWQETRLVGKVRLCLAFASRHAIEPTVLIVPFDQSGKESVLNHRVFHGAASMLAGLNRLGFLPELSNN